ncbi:hypothetical protein ACHAXT_008376 [Thalassiosira profunda]
MAIRMLFGALPKSKETGKRRTVKRAFEVAHHGGYLYSSYSTGAGNPIGKPICRIRKSTENSDVWGITAEGKKHLGFNAKGKCRDSLYTIPILRRNEIGIPVRLAAEDEEENVDLKQEWDVDEGGKGKEEKEEE